MSSPTNVVIQISTPGFNKETCADVARNRQAAWRDSPERLTAKDGVGYALTDQLIDEFYNRVVSEQAYSWGMEGDQLIFAFDGDYIGVDDLLAELAVFVRALTESGDHPPYSVSATIFAAHEDACCYAYKISDESDYRARSFGKLAFGFDKDVGEGEVLQTEEDKENEEDASQVRATMFGVRTVVAAACPGADVRLEAQGDNVSGFVLWDGFEDMDQLARQRHVWRALDSRLSQEDRARVRSLLTMTPQEAS